MQKNKDIKPFFSGQADYMKTLEWQNQVWTALVAKESPQFLWLGEHNSTITCGRRAEKNNILADESMLAERSTKLYEIDRGGDVTWHGPGQLVGYPLIDLKNFRMDLKWYLKQVEEVLVQALKKYNLQAFTIEDKTGVWVSHKGVEKKIACIGIHVSRWVTKHGFALNVCPDMSFFDMINPCGLSCEMTSMEQLMEPGSSPGVEEVSEEVLRCFLDVFEANLIEVKP